MPVGLEMEEGGVSWTWRWAVGGKAGPPELLVLGQPCFPCQLFLHWHWVSLPSADWVKIPGTAPPTPQPPLQLHNPSSPPTLHLHGASSISLSCSTDTPPGEWAWGRRIILYTHRSYPVLDFQVEIRIGCTASICTVGHGLV